MSTQAEHLASVSSRIGDAIIEFARRRVGCEWHADDLREHVTRTVGTVAPGSADRVLRDLRQRGAIEYVVVSRAASRYRVDSISPIYDLI